MSWPKIRKIVILKSHRLLLCTTTANHFFFQLWHATKADFIQQLAMTSSVVGLRKSSRAKLAPEGSHGHCLVVCYQSYPLQLSQSQWNHYIWSMLSKSMRCIKNWNACSWHWSTEWAQFSMTTSNCKLHNQRFKNWMNCATEFYLVRLPYSHDLLPTYYHFFKDLDSFLQRKCSHNKQKAENAFSQSSSNPKVCTFYAVEMNKLISYWQKCVDCNDSYFE